MTQSPNMRMDCSGDESRPPSSDSRAEISMVFHEAEIKNIDSLPDVQLGRRFADLHLPPDKSPTIVLPRKSEGIPPMLLSTKYEGAAFYPCHDVRRLVINHEDEDRVVTLREWLVDMTIGACWPVESRRKRAQNTTAESGPLLTLDPTSKIVTLSEGNQYLADVEAFVPMMKSDTSGQIPDFMSETEEFLGGVVTDLPKFRQDAFRHVRSYNLS